MLSHRYEIERQCGVSAECLEDEAAVVVVNPRGGKKRFGFDAAFGPSTTDAEIYGEAAPLLGDEGHAVVFAYGQTGSGKTFTMTNIVLRAIPATFDDKNVKVSSYFLELHNDTIIDLYADENPEDNNLKVRRDAAGLVVVKGSVVKQAETSEELLGHFEAGNAKRKTNAERGLRSHSIFVVLVTDRSVILDQHGFNQSRRMGRAPYGRDP
jgi:kinesin family protein C1